ncbi:MAG: transglutaminase-like domain-containing protein [Deltaproteobacteria bacterium]|nr:transglutaminase-like domain-containing protein [Deltaproteobacteria bacterium]
MKAITKVALFISWLILFAMLLQRDYLVKTLDTRETIALEQDKILEFQGIYFDNKKIGYVENHFLPEAGALRIRQKAVMRLNIANQSHLVELRLEAILQSDNTLNTFDFVFSSPFYQMKARGSVNDTLVSFSLDTGNSTINDQIQLNAPPMISTSRRGYLLNQGMSKGEKVRLPLFDPLSLTAKETVVEYWGKEQVLVQGRVFNLHRFTEMLAGARINSWLDDDGNVIKEESPAGFVFIKEPEYKARSLDENSSELLSFVSVKISSPMPDLQNRKSLRYRLNLPTEVDFDLNAGRQKFSEGILTVTMEEIPSHFSGDIPCDIFSSELQSSPYIQSSTPEIIKQSQDIITTARNPLQKVEMLANWVYQEIDKRPVLGIPDALTTLKNRIGDCNEHASLFAALARASGIPTKIAAGVVFHKNAFYYHAWNEVCLNGDWFSLDTTTGQFPADLSHIKFVEGELQEQIRIGALIGSLQIEPLPAETEAQR